MHVIDTEKQTLMFVVYAHSMSGGLTGLYGDQ